MELHWSDTVGGEKTGALLIIVGAAIALLAAEGVSIGIGGFPLLMLIGGVVALAGSIVLFSTLV